MKPHGLLVYKSKILRWKIDGHSQDGFNVWDW